MSSYEFSEWIAYAQIEPFGEYRDDLRSALIASVMANAWRGSKSKPYKIKDFLLNFEPPKQQSWQEMKSIIKQIASK